MVLPGLLAAATVATAADATIEVRQLSSAHLDGLRPPRPAVIEGEHALRRQWERRDLLGDPPTIDFEHAVVVLLAAPIGPGREIVPTATLDGRRLVVTPEHIAPGAAPTADVRARLVAVEVPLGLLPATRVRVHQDGWLSAALPRRRPDALPTPPTDALPAPEAVRGRVPLPPPGTVAWELLDDGTPVWAVHHPDGAVAVIASEGTNGGAPTHITWDGRWCTPDRWGWRHFLGPAWDAAGASYLGAALPPLERHLVVVDGGTLIVGDRVQGTSAPATVPLRPLVVHRSDPAPDDTITLEQAAALPDGSVVFVEAALARAGGTGPWGLCEVEGCHPEGCDPASMTPVDGSQLDHLAEPGWNGVIRVTTHTDRPWHAVPVGSPLPLRSWYDPYEPVRLGVCEELDHEGALRSALQRAARRAANPTELAWWLLGAPCVTAVTRTPDVSGGSFDLTLQTVTADGPSTSSWRFVWKEGFGTRTRLDDASPDRSD
jgi:hypothetical protein